MNGCVNCGDYCCGDCVRVVPASFSQILKALGGGILIVGFAYLLMVVVLTAARA